MARDKAAAAPDVIAGWAIRGIGGVTNMIETYRPDAIEHWSEQNLMDLANEVARLNQVAESILSYHGLSVRDAEGNLSNQLTPIPDDQQSMRDPQNRDSE